MSDPPPAVPETSAIVRYSDLANAVSTERLSTLRSTGDTDDAVLARYFWNQAIVDAFGLSVHMVEVALRNAIVRVGDQHFGVPTRHGGVPSWLDAQPPVPLQFVRVFHAVS